MPTPHDLHHATPLVEALDQVVTRLIEARGVEVPRLESEAGDLPLAFHRAVMIQTLHRLIGDEAARR
jgi:hypothetical protein